MIPEGICCSAHIRSIDCNPPRSVYLIIQFSTFNFGTRRNSLRLSVTGTAFSETVCVAIKRSIAPMGCPSFLPSRKYRAPLLGLGVRITRSPSLSMNTSSVSNRYPLGGCPRIENLLRKSPFGQIFRSFSLNSHHYSPQMIKKSDSKWLSLATAPILGQPPRNADRLATAGDKHLCCVTWHTEFPI